MPGRKRLDECVRPRVVRGPCHQAVEGECLAVSAGGKRLRVFFSAGIRN